MEKQHLHHDEVARLELIKRMKPLGFSVQQMRELLDARDRLDGSEPVSRVDVGAIERLGRYVAETKERIEAERAKLDASESFAETLAEELRRHRRRAGAQRA